VINLKEYETTAPSGGRGDHRC